MTRPFSHINEILRIVLLSISPVAIATLLVAPGGMEKLFAAGGSVGGASSAEFLKINTGVRPSSMAGAYTAVSDDNLALYYNPAGLSQLESGNGISASYNKWILDTSVSNFIYAHSFDEYGTAALGFTYYDSGAIEGRGEYKDQTTGDFKNTSMAAVLGYGNEFFEGFSCGLSAKFIAESVNSESTSGFAADLGIHYKTILDFGEVSGGAALKNIGSKLWENYSLPLTATLGIAAKPVKNFLLVSADYSLPQSGGGASSGGVGFEITPSDSLSLRAGYRIGLADVSGIYALTFGFGYKYITESEEDGGISEYIFNYGFSTQGDLGLVHRVEIGYAF